MLRRLLLLLKICIESVLLLRMSRHRRLLRRLLLLLKICIETILLLNLRHILLRRLLLKMWVESLLGRRHLLLKFRLLNNILLWISILHLHLRLRLLLYLLKVSLIRLLLYMCMLWGNRLFWKISIEPGILMRLPGRGRRLRVIRIKTGLHLLLLGRIRRLLRKVRMEANGSLSLGRGWLRLMLHWFRLRGRLSKVRLEGSLLISTTIL